MHDPARRARSLPVIGSLLALAAVAFASAAGCDNGSSSGLCSDDCAGCCDFSGVCRSGNTPDNCGIGGRCKLCQPGQVCKDGVCIPDCASNCNGCCDVNGDCLQSTDQHCGVDGEACVVCQPETSCQRGQCVTIGPTCGPGNCQGCCRGNECVLPGNTSDACGSGGSACARCSETHDCIAGRCQRDPCAACAAEDQCCYEGKCFPGDTFGLCGKAGETCASCETGQTCEDRACVDISCDADHCPDGCCKDDGTCHLPGPSDAEACGEGGVQCKDCPGDQICKAGACEDPPPSCDPTQCDGCCDADGKCVDGDTNQACGNGTDCVSCGSSQECVAGACTCTADSCDGCCDGDVCRGGADNDACGKDGADCDQCTGAESCTNGACAEVCDADTCATGCCDGDTCHHDGATDPAKCGVGGVDCKPCDEAAGEECVDGVCNNPIACGPGGADPCATGCCAGGVCEPGTTDDLCGYYGESCSTCPTWGFCETSYSEYFCDATDQSLWKVTLTRVILDTSVEWDGASDPDVFVEVTVGSQTKTSSTVDNNYLPWFNELLMTASGLDLKTEIKYVIWDDDTWPGTNTKILECSDVIYPDEFLVGFASIDYPCGNASSNPVELIRFEITPASP